VSEKPSASDESPDASVPPCGEDPAVTVIPLEQASIGQEVVLCRVAGGHGLLHRLAELGLRPGARFSVLSRGRPGPFIVTMRHTRLVLGQGLVHRMMVRPA